MQLVFSGLEYNTTKYNGLTALPVDAACSGKERVYSVYQKALGLQSSEC
jgi:hypothetical protein